MNAIDIQGLRKIYANDRMALCDIDLCIEEGDFFALLGPNGAGKSTTIGILSGLVDKTGGRVSVFGHDIDTHVNQAKAMIGIVPQEINFSLFERCLDIIVNQGGYYGMPRREALGNAEKYMRLLDLWERRHEPSRLLSGGMKRRLMIARAMVHEPRMLILDEPTAGIDVELRRSTWDFLTQLNQCGVSILLTTHYLEEAERLCRNIAIIDHGQIIIDTSMKRLLDTMNKEVLVLELSEPMAPTSLAQEYHSRFIDETTLEVELDREHGLNALFTELSQRDIAVKGIRNRNNRLEELFLSMVTEREERDKP